MTKLKVEHIILLLIILFLIYHFSGLSGNGFSVGANCGCKNERNGRCTLSGHISRNPDLSGGCNHLTTMNRCQGNNYCKWTGYTGNPTPIGSGH